MGALAPCWQERNMMGPLWEAAWRSLGKLRLELSCAPAPPLAGVCPPGRERQL